MTLAIAAFVVTIYGVWVGGIVYFHRRENQNPPESVK
jgi:hypothetical protein